MRPVRHFFQTGGRCPRSSGDGRKSEKLPSWSHRLYKIYAHVFQTGYSQTLRKMKNQQDYEVAEVLSFCWGLVFSTMDRELLNNQSGLSGKLVKYLKESWRLRDCKKLLDKILKILETRSNLIHMFTFHSGRVN